EPLDVVDAETHVDETRERLAEVWIEPRLLIALDDLPIITARREVLLLRVERLAAQPERVDVARRVGELLHDLGEDDDGARIVLRPIEELAVRDALLDGVPRGLRLFDRGLDAVRVAIDESDLLLRAGGIAVAVRGARRLRRRHRDHRDREAEQLTTHGYFPPPTEMLPPALPLP